MCDCAAGAVTVAAILDIASFSLLVTFLPTLIYSSIVFYFFSLFPSLFLLLNLFYYLLFHFPLFLFPI
jgi:hypothetical protein